MLTLGDLRKKFLGMINYHSFIWKNLDETNFIKIICANLNWWTDIMKFKWAKA